MISNRANPLEITFDVQVLETAANATVTNANTASLDGDNGQRHSNGQRRNRYLARV